MIPPVSQSSGMPGTYQPQPSDGESTETRLPEPPSSVHSSEESQTQLMTIPPKGETSTEPESDWIQRMNSQ